MTHDGQIGVTFTSDGHKLLGTLFIAPRDDPKPTAILLHGIPGIEKNVDLALTLRENGWNSLLFHYRGCWGSEGDYTLNTIPTDVTAALDYLSNGRHPQVDAGKLVLIGHSLGGWAAILAAADDDRVHAVAVIGAVTDPRPLIEFDAEVAAEHFTPWLNGMTPQQFEDQWRALGSDFAPVEHVVRLAPRPLLIIHAEADADVPVSQAHALAERARQPHNIIIHPDANHSFTWHRGWLNKTILTWLRTLDL